MGSRTGAYPCLYSRILVSQEAQIEVAGSFAIERKAIHAFCRVRGKEVLEENVYGMANIGIQQDTTKVTDLRNSSSVPCLNFSCAINSSHLRAIACT